MAANVPIIFNEALNVSCLPTDAPLAWRQQRSVGLYGVLRARTRSVNGQRCRTLSGSFAIHQQVLHVLLYVTALRTLTCACIEMDRLYLLDLSMHGLHQYQHCHDPWVHCGSNSRCGVEGYRAESCHLMHAVGFLVTEEYMSFLGWIQSYRR